MDKPSEPLPIGQLVCRSYRHTPNAESGHRCGESADPSHALPDEPNDAGLPGPAQQYRYDTERWTGDPHFGIFVTGSDTVLFAPAVNRIFLRFKDSGGMIRGSTSVGVWTQ